MTDYAPTTHVDIEMVRGDQLDVEIKVRDRYCGPVDLTGAALRCTGKHYYQDGDELAVFALAIGAGITVDDAADGHAMASVPPSATISEADADVTLVYDVQIKDADGKVHTVQMGKIVVHPDVTRTTA